MSAHREPEAPERVDPGAVRAGTSLVARDRRVAWHPYTQAGLERDPLPVASARGATLVLDDGREVVDAISSWWTCLHGHGDPRIVAAIAEQAARLDHVLFAGATHEPAVRLAEELVRLAPRGLTRVFYSDDGSTAVEVALKIAWQSWIARGERQRTAFVAFDGGYHGDTFGAMSVGDPDPFFAPFTPLLFHVERIAPRSGALEAKLAELGDRACAVIGEPLVQGAGGMRMHSAALVREVRAACDAHGVPWIADEVMTGFGRTGKLFACEHAGVAPDLLCLAKGLTGGTLPLSATLASEALFEAFVSNDRSKAFFHGHSFTASPIGCAAALASLAIVREERTPDALDRIGARIHARLSERLHGAAHASDLRRVGGIVAFDLAAGDAGYLSNLALRLRAAALERGVLLRPLGNVVYAMPPSCTSDAQCDRIADTMAELAEHARR